MEGHLKTSTTRIAEKKHESLFEIRIPLDIPFVVF